MRLSIVFLALLGLALAQSGPKLLAADQELLQKQQDVIHLLENIAGELPHGHLYEMGMNWEFEPNLHNYENPLVVKYYVGLVKTGHVQPRGTPFSVSVSVLRKEVALLAQILIGAKDYQTFLHTAAWARIHINIEQFVKALSSAVLLRHDMHGVILPPAYEVFPHYFFDTRIIQKVHDYILLHGANLQQSQGEHLGGRLGVNQGIHYVHVNYTSQLPYGENKIAYLTDDIGLNAYYSYVLLAQYMLPNSQYIAQKQAYPQGGEVHDILNGHGAHYYYLHQQLLARYNLERLGQGLDPIRELDNNWEHIETPYKPHLRYLNGENMPGRDEHIYITPRHHNYELVKLVRTLERRIVDAIDSGYVITPAGSFLSLYQPGGLSILGELIEGTGSSINPRYYGAFQAVSKQLLGNVPEWSNIYEYSPSSLELGQSAIRDPVFWQLYAKIIELFHYYQEALPAYQYNDIVVPGVKIEKVDVSELVTYFSDFEVDLSNAVPQVVGLHQEQPSYPIVKAIMKRLDHKPYEYTVHVSAQKAVPGAVIRVYVGPKYNYEGLPIDINVHRHYFYEIDQFVYDLIEGQNVIVRNSHQATGQSYDWPSVQQIKEKVEGALRSQNPFYIVKPEQLFGFPARLSLPKGSQSGYPLQWFVIISSGIHHQPQKYGPIVEEEWMTYQPQHYQVVGVEEYSQFSSYPIDKVTGGYQTVEVIPEFENQIITDGNWHWGYLYKKYPGSYYYPQWQQIHYNAQGVESLQHVGVHEHHHHHEHQILHGHQMLNEHQIDPELQHYAGKYSSEHVSHLSGQTTQGLGVEHKMPHTYQRVVEHPEVGKIYQTVHKQGMYHGMLPVSGVEYHGSGHLPGSSEYHATYPAGSFQGHQGHLEYMQNYYENKYIGNIIGGAVSLDNKPLGYPFDRQLAHSAFYVPNIYVKDVVVYHHDEIIPEY